jgi:hypothetical protein
METRTAVWLMVAVVAFCAGYGTALGIAARARTVKPVVPAMPPAAVSVPVAPAVNAGALPDSLAILGSCMRRLDAAEARLRGASDAPARGANEASPSPAGVSAPGAASVATDPAAGAPAPETVPDPPAMPEPRAFARGFMAHVLDAREEEARWLQQYVCLVDDLRARTERDLSRVFDDPARAADHAAIDAVAGEAKQERDAMLADIEGRIGKEHYKRLRDLGGLGILSRACTK